MVRLPCYYYFVVYKMRKMCSVLLLNLAIIVCKAIGTNLKERKKERIPYILQFKTYYLYTLKNKQN